MEVLRNAAGFLGTQATLLTDINLVVQILFYIVLCLGIVAQRKQKYHLHDKLQTPVVVLNLLFILLVMIPSARFVVREIPARLSETYFLIPTVHMVLGTLAEGLAIYCMLAGFKILPRKIGTLRYFMWATFTLWTAAVIFGIGIYIIWYGMPYGPTPAGSSAVVAEHDEETVVAEQADEAEAGQPEAEEVAEVAEHDEETVILSTEDITDTAESAPTPPSGPT
jgi:uncharacterized membrane protein YozB (DUF420 family)